VSCDFLSLIACGKKIIDVGIRNAAFANRMVLDYGAASVTSNNGPVLDDRDTLGFCLR
jgi:hypothetical protein